MTTTPRLTSATRSAAASGPGYDRTSITPGIVHFGVGGFHRAHQALYLDTLMNQGKAFDYGIIGMGVMPSDVRMRDALAGQDHLYTLSEKSAHGSVTSRIVGSIIDYVFAPEDPARAVGILSDPRIRIVSLTVTEGGYNFDHLTGEFNARNEHIAHDTAELRAGRTTNLRTFFGLITAALIRRRDDALTPFTIMSCDNIQGNGDIAHRMFLAFAGGISPDLAAWIDANVAFPNSMVDRITPETTDTDRTEVIDRLGYRDAWPVVCEDFTQWVLEDTFTAGRPPLEDAGVQLVSDVVPFELMKLRLLNASHQGLCYFGYLAGHTEVAEVMADRRFREFLLAYMEREASPTLLPLPGTDLNAYRHQLIERFGNKAVRDTVARLCAESSDRIPTWLLPVIRENLDAGRGITFSAAIVASWARYAEAVDDKGRPIPVVDRLSDTLVPAAQRYQEDALSFLRLREVFGDLVDSTTFTDSYLTTLRDLHEHGAEATLDRLLSTAG
nr:mannitol dehydrogenase family protein [Corynebacterium pacaense]